MHNCSEPHVHPPIKFTSLRVQKVAEASHEAETTCSGFYVDRLLTVHTCLSYMYSMFSLTRPIKPGIGVHKQTFEELLEEQLRLEDQKLKSAQQQQVRELNKCFFFTKLQIIGIFQNNIFVSEN